MVKTLICLASVVGIAAAGAHAQRGASSPACGSVVTQDVTLHRSLVGCTQGLIVGADGVTIDLNGFSIRAATGSAAASGVEAIGRSDVTVRNGSISGFSTGVRFQAATGSTVEDLTVTGTTTAITVSGHSNEPPFASNDVLGNVISDSVNGIVMLASGGRIAGNRIADLSDGADPGPAGSLRGVGILCRDLFSEGELLIENNAVTRAELGIFAFFCGADLVRNVTAGNTHEGIRRDRSNGLTQANRADGNGRDGINAFDSHGLYAGNVTNANGGNGISIGDSIPQHGPFHTVRGNVANANAGFGIFVGLADVIDGGGNRAHANGAPAECSGVVCG